MFFNEKKVLGANTSRMAILKNPRKRTFQNVFKDNTFLGRSNILWTNQKCWSGVFPSCL